MRRVYTLLQFGDSQIICGRVGPLDLFASCGRKVRTNTTAIRRALMR